MKNDYKTLFLILGFFAVVLIFWNTPFIYPLKLFTVLLHEISHGLAAELSGGDMLRIEISPEQGGVCYTQGGLRFVILPAGYLGSMLWGNLLIILAARTSWDKKIAIVLGVIIFLISILYVSNGFGFIFSLIFGVALILSGLFLNENINDLLLKFIGTTSALYAIIDIKDDLLVRSIPGSDAWAMSEEIFPLPPFVWGVIWIIISIFLTYKSLQFAIRYKSKTG